MSIAQIKSATQPAHSVRIHLEGRVRKVDLVRAHGHIVVSPCQVSSRDRSASDMYKPLGALGVKLLGYNWDETDA